jgi:hypothetical protein
MPPILLFFALACRQAPPSEKGGSDSSSTTDPAAKPVTLVINERVPTVVTVSWAPEAASTVWVEYQLDGGPLLSTPKVAPGEGGASLTLLGLKAGRTYAVQARSQSADGSIQDAEPASVTLPPPPSALSRFLISEYDTARAAPGGFILTTLMQQNAGYVVIIDRDGDYVWYAAVEDGLISPGAKLNPRNRSILFSQYDIMQRSDYGGVRRISLDGSESTLTRTPLGHHDFTQLPDGTVAWLAMDLRDVVIDGEDLYVGSDTIMEAPEGAGDDAVPATIFSFFDDYPVAPWIQCSHFWGEVFETGAYDWTHSNSIMYDSSRDSYWVMTKNLNGLHEIDRATGTQLRQIGGLYSDYTVENRDDGWIHGHMSHRWEGGFMVFDNGYHRDPDHSRVVEYAIDEDSQTLSATFVYPDPDGRFIPLLGDAQKLESSYMTSWSAAGMLIELAPDGTPIWRAESEVGSALGRSTYIADLYDLSALGDF